MISESQIEEIVGRVVQELRQREKLAIQQVNVPATERERNASEVCVLNERVVTLAVVEKLTVRPAELRVPTGAVITPSVRDWLREQEVELVIETSPQKNLVSPNRLVWLVRWRTNMSDEACCHVKMTGNVQSEWYEGADAIQRVHQRLRDEQGSCRLRVVLFTDFPALALCELNREKNVRAAACADMASLRDSLTTLQHNVLVLDTRHSRVKQLVGLVSEFGNASP